MAHLVHGVVSHMAMHGPIAGFVRNEIEGASRADGSEDSGFHLLGGFGDLAAIGFGDAKLVAVEVDGVMVHGVDVGEPDANALAEFGD